MAVAFGTTILGTSSSSSTSAAVNFTGRSAGEYALVLISRDNTSTPSTTPSGWTLLQALSSTYRHMLYGKLLASGDLGTVTWSGFTAGKTLAQAVVYTGVHQTTPVAASTAGTFATGSARTIDFGSLNTSAPFIVALAGCYSTSSKTYDVSSEGLTERLDSGNTAPEFWQYIGDKTHSGGTFAPSTSTNYISDNATYRGGFLVALNRAAETLDLTLGIESSSAVSASAARNVIGNTNPGSTLYDGMNDWYMQEVFAGPPVSGVVCTKLYAYVNNGATACKAAMGIHELASGTSGNWTHLGHSNAVDIAANQAWGWVEFALQSPVNLRSDRYYLIELFGNENAGVMNTHWDGTSGLGNVRNSRDFDSGFPSSGTFYPSSYQTFPFYGRYTPVADLALGIESASALTTTGNVAQAVADLVLATESVSGVSASGAKSVVVTHDVTFAVEAVSAVTAGGAATQAVWDVVLAATSASGVTASAASVQAVVDVLLAVEAVSTVTATGAEIPAGVVHDLALALASASSLVASAAVTQAVQELSLGPEAASSVTAAGASLEAIIDLALVLEAKSNVGAQVLVVQALCDLALAVESTSAVAATATFLRYRPNVDLAAALVESGWKADVDTAGMCARLASHGWQATLTGS